MIKIKLEREKDYYEVENLTREAFWNVYRPGCFEHLIIHKLRNDKCFVKSLDYIMKKDNIIIANIVYALGNIKTKNGENKNILLFGPVSVLPKYQKLGYGEKLINFTIEKAKKLGFPAIVITGDPMYYKKFGFESASKYEIYYEGIDKTKESPFFMIKVLNKRKVKKLKGVYSDPKCYIVKDNELKIFDKNFPKKIKRRLKGQL